MDIERSMLHMTLWRCWYIRNEIVHQKNPPPLDVSRKFLVSYLESLIAVKMNSNMDRLKGKTNVSYDRTLLNNPVQCVKPSPSWVPPPVVG